MDASRYRVSSSEPVPAEAGAAVIQLRGAECAGDLKLVRTATLLSRRGPDFSPVVINNRHRNRRTD